jgi:hypothetical protein
MDIVFALIFVAISGATALAAVGCDRLSRRQVKP